MSFDVHFIDGPLAGTERTIRVLATRPNIGMQFAANNSASYRITGPFGAPELDVWAATYLGGWQVEGQT